MLEAVWPVAGPALRLLGPEAAHRAAIAALEWTPLRRAPACDPRLSLKAFGLDFPNPVGLAAGFDKDARVPDRMLALGFGFVEVGSITPKPQAGNPKPRMFRLAEDLAVVNRMGFNNKGADTAELRLSRRMRRPGVVGVNIGANKDSKDRIADYVEGVRRFAAHASYLVVNVSSPNTPGLRALQNKGALDELVIRAIDARDAASRSGPRRPVLLKIAPDLDLRDLDDVVAIARLRKLDGIIVSNTTVSRPESLKSAQAGEEGGLSGRPLFARSTWMLAQTYLRTGKAMPIVGVGGVSSGADAIAKILAGATLVQLYTGLVYEGPSLVSRIKADLLAEIERENLASIEAIVGQDAVAVAAAGPGD